MPNHHDILILGGTICNPNTITKTDIAINNKTITQIGNLNQHSANQTINAKNLHILPGIIDSQTHLREPDTNPAENLLTGSRAAILGGTTTIFDMPNTNPPTTTPKHLRDKLQRAKNTMLCNYAFYAGGTKNNIPILAEMEKIPACPGVKIFMGASTGSLLTDEDETIAEILKATSKTAAFHAEDQTRLIARAHKREKGKVQSHAVWRDPQTALKATRRLLHLAKKTGRRVHILHISTGGEMALLKRHKNLASVETTPQHLTLTAPECYERLGAYAQMNPPIRSAHHRQALWKALREGTVDVIGSDHAPHPREEKDKTYPNTPSGMTGAQTLLPIMLHHMNRGRLSLRRLVQLTSAAPAELFGIPKKGRIAPNYDADLTIVDLKARREITNSQIQSLCKWTPFDGMRVQGWPIGTILGGRLVMWHGELTDEPPRGQPIHFTRPPRSP